jgi:hypothetical protein
MATSACLLQTENGYSVYLLQTEMGRAHLCIYRNGSIYNCIIYRYSMLRYIYIYIYIFIYISISVYIYMLRFKRKTEAQAIFLNPFTV